MGGKNVKERKKKPVPKECQNNSGDTKYVFTERNVAEGGKEDARRFLRKIRMP